MKISWNYLNQFIDLNDINIINITDILTLAGLEVESTIFNRTTSDTILDICLTTNRQDVTGLIHIAIELSALLKKTLKVSNSNSQVLRGIQVYRIKQIDLTHQSDYLAQYLPLLQINTTYSILDKINFINFKWGQRFKAYKINFSIQTDISPSQFSIYINKNQKIHYDTTILQEIDAKYEDFKQSIQDIILINHKKTHYFRDYIYQDLIQILDIHDQQITLLDEFINKKYQENHLHLYIECKLEKIRNILGPTDQTYNRSKLTDEQIISTLKRLGFQINKINNSLKIKTPEERIEDIKYDIDIVEEIGRMYGFNHFTDNIPYFYQATSINPISQFKYKVRRILRSNGLHEIISYSFQGKKNGYHYSIVNPLNQEQTALRNNLLENLITTKRHNVYQNNKPFEVFEIGNVFLKQTINQKEKESTNLCCLIGNDAFNQLNWKDKQSCLTWYQAKGQIEELFEKLNAQVSWSTNDQNNSFIQSIDKYIHPTRSIYIQYKQQTIGILSQLNYRINSLMGINQTIYFFEIDIIQLAKSVFTHNQLKYNYSSYPNYPKISRDLSIIVKKSISMEKIASIIYLIKKDLNSIIESIKVINNYYYNSHSRNICLRIQYRSLEKTLKSIEVETVNNKFKETLYTMLESKT